MKRRGEADYSRDLPRRQSVVKPQPEQQAIRGVEACDRSGERAPPGRDAELAFKIDRTRNVGEDFIALDRRERGERTPVLMVEIRLIALASVDRAIMIEAEAAHDNNEPGRESRSAVSPEGTQPAEVVLAKPLEKVGVAIHDLVVPAAAGTGDMQ